MINFFCLECERVFQGDRRDEVCPHCSSEAVEEVTPDVPEDGHYEGGFEHDPVKQYWKDSGIEE